LPRSNGIDLKKYFLYNYLAFLEEELGTSNQSMVADLSNEEEELTLEKLLEKARATNHAEKFSDEEIDLETLLTVGSAKGIKDIVEIPGGAAQRIWVEIQKAKRRGEEPQQVPQSPSKTAIYKAVHQLSGENQELRRELRQEMSNVKNTLEMIRGQGKTPLETDKYRRMSSKGLYEKLKKDGKIAVLDHRGPPEVLVPEEEVPDNFFKPEENQKIRHNHYETRVQRYGNSQFLQFKDKLKLLHEDTHKFGLLPSGNMPDNSFLAESFQTKYGSVRLVASGVVYDLEWKRVPKRRSQCSQFVAEDKGELIDYLLQFMDIMGWRNEMYGSLCNLVLFQQFKVTRQDGSLFITEYAPVFFDDEGRILLWTILTGDVDLGFNIPRPIDGNGEEMSLVVPFAGGGTCLAWLSEDDKVYKTFTQESMEHFKDEQEIYYEFANHQQLHSMVPELISVGQNFLCIPFLGTPVTSSHPTSVFVNVVQCLKCVHALEILHGDIRPANIVVDKNKGSLIDWGHSYKRGEKQKAISLFSFGIEESAPFAGELVAVVLCIVYLKEFHSIGVCLPRSKDEKEIKNYWLTRRIPGHYWPVIDAACEENYDLVCDLLKSTTWEEHSSCNPSLIGFENLSID